MADKTLGQIAYETYCKGHNALDWELLGLDSKESWREVVRAIMIARPVVDTRESGEVAFAEHIKDVAVGLGPCTDEVARLRVAMELVLRCRGMWL